jgi:hypothetical protein
MMSRMIHGLLPTCEKITRLIEVEQRNEKRYKDYFLDKYGKSANKGMCPCCEEEKETVKYLFVECNNENIIEIRTKLPKQINRAIAKHVEDVWVNTNFIKPTPQKIKWDSYLANLGLISTKTTKEISDQLEDGQKNLLKKIVADISNNIMEINLEIWKYRCKILFSSREEVT